LSPSSGLGAKMYIFDFDKTKEKRTVDRVKNIEHLGQFQQRQVFVTKLYL